jgi:hypothetical protein
MSRLGRDQLGCDCPLARFSRLVAHHTNSEMISTTK